MSEEVVRIPLSEGERVAVVVATTLVAKWMGHTGTPNFRLMEQVALDMEGDYVFSVLEEPYTHTQPVVMELQLDPPAARVLAATLREATYYETRPGIPTQFMETMWEGLVDRCAEVADRIEARLEPPSLACRLGRKIGARKKQKP
jgi:hypothetical protein